MLRHVTPIVVLEVEGIASIYGRMASVVRVQ